MFIASCWIIHPSRTYLAIPKIKRIGYEESIRFSSDDLSYLDVLASSVRVLRNYQCALMCNTIKQTERRGCHVHLSVAYHDVAITPKAFDAPVPMDILVVCIEKVPVADHQVEYRIPVAVRLGWVPAEHVVYRATIMITGRHLAVAVVRHLTARVSQALYLISFGVSHKTEIRVGVPSPALIIEVCFLEAGFKPVLEVKLLILCGLAYDQGVLTDRCDATRKYVCTNHMLSTTPGSSHSNEANSVGEIARDTNLYIGSRTFSRQFPVSVSVVRRRYTFGLTFESSPLQ